jgi:hypothetical protein
MGQLNSVIIPAVHKDIITAEDRIYPHLRISVTQKYHYSGNEHHYSLVKRKIHGSLVVTPTDLYLFRHRSVAMHVRLDDERWHSGKISATYEEGNTLNFSVDIKAFQKEIKHSIFSPPSRFESGTLILSCSVTLPSEVVDIICRPSLQLSQVTSPMIVKPTVIQAAV